MLRLATLGGLMLTDPAGKPVPVQRRRLALLALLAVAGERGLSRDKLLALLWPESTTEHARHALEQLVYSVRRQLPEAVVLGPDPLRLNSAVVTSDVAEFEQALSRGESAEAAALYQGPFLDGFYLGDASGFEEWVEAERARLAGEHSGALYRLAKEAGGDERHTAEIDWWRQLTSFDPLGERANLGFIRALAAAGDRANALKAARAYEARVKGELDLPAADELAAVLEQLQAPAPPAAPRDEPGEAGRYTLERELARGRVATIHLARDRKHGRPVAVKLLKPAVATSLEAKRFLREIAIVAGLHHPHIVPLYDSGQMALSGGTRLYYVMPYLSGESLRARLAREGALPLRSALQIAREVADALAYAHARGIVHRDISPANILLEAGHALVADFGLAHALDLAGGERLSLSGVTLGTPGYMSPEQAAGAGDIDGRTDVYSLGSVLYEALTGGPPFSGATAQAVLARHAADPVPPLRTVRPEVPPAVEATVLRALAKRPADRFAGAAEFGQALAADAEGG